MKSGVRRIGSALGLALLVAASASAQDGTTLAVHGFGGWAVGYTDNDNNYAATATSELEFDNYNFALNLTAKPTDRLTINTQLNWRSNLQGREVEPDYVFAQWSFAPQASVRVGKVKSPFGLYTEVFDVGTLRPFYLLPQSVYGAPGLVSKSYEGAGLTGSQSLGRGWDLQYDLFGGELHLQDFQAEFPVGTNPQTHLPIFASTTQSLVGHDVLGGKLLVAPPVPGLQLGASYVKMHMEGIVEGVSYGTVSYTLWALHGEYLTASTSVRAEYFRAEPEKGVPYSTLAKGAYLEAARKLTSAVQLAAIYEWHREHTETSTPRPAQMEEHDAVGLGVNYWAAPNVVFKLSYYSVRGNLFASPPSYMADLLLGRVPEKKTNVVLFGTQFSF